MAKKKPASRTVQRAKRSSRTSGTRPAAKVARRATGPGRSNGSSTRHTPATRRINGSASPRTAARPGRMASPAGMAQAFVRKLGGSARSWTEVYNAMFGVGGKCSELFPTAAERTAFSRTKEFAEIMGLIDALREQQGDEPAIAPLTTTANGKLSVRLPRSLHAALLAEAKAEAVSLNQLILAKLAVQLCSIA